MSFDRKKSSRFIDGFYEFLWRLGEIYMVRIALFCQLVMSLKISPVNLITIFLFEFGIGCSKSGFYMVIITALIQIVLAVLSIVYEQIKPGLLNDNKSLIGNHSCGNESDHHMSFGNSRYLGLKSDSQKVNYFIVILSIILVAFIVIIRVRQRIRRKSRDLADHSYDVIFPDAYSRAKMKDTFVMLIKYGCNYLFYKIGMELSLGLIALNGLLRMDLIGSIYLFMLFPMSLIKRNMAKCLWSFFIGLVGFLLVLQYACFLGLPIQKCSNYYWKDIMKIQAFNDNLIDFLGLPNSHLVDRTSLYVKFLMDAVTMIVMCAQANVFEYEDSSHNDGSKEKMTDMNITVLMNEPPTNDFISHTKTYIDYVKTVVTMSSHWIALTCFLISGFGGRSLFNIGYLMLAFYLLWQGNGIYQITGLSTTLVYWKLLLVYNLLSMFLKVCLQLLACVYVAEVYNQCQVRQLLNVVCFAKESYTRVEGWAQNNTAGGCEGLKDNTYELPVDVLSYIFVLLHIRLLYSKMFQWCVLELTCEDVQANSGAILINKLITKEVKDQFEKQVRTLTKIEQRSTKLRADYEGNNNQHKFHPETYHQAKLSADLYMFDQDPQEMDLEVDEEMFISIHGVENPDDLSKLNPVQIIYAFVAQDFDCTDTLNAVNSAEQVLNEEMRMLEAVSRRHNDDDSLELFAAKRKQLRNEVCLSGESTIPRKKEGLKPFTLLVIKLCSATLHHMTCFLRRHSRQHRYVNHVLGQEKKILKENILRTLQETSQFVTPRSTILNIEDVKQVEKDARALENEYSDFGRFLRCLFNYICANTDSLCFIWAILTHAYCGGLITMPLPFLIFFWGCLSNPRAEKTFWVCMMIYTQMVIVVKCVSQLYGNTVYSAKLFERRFNTVEVRSFLGIQEGVAFAVFDVILLLLLFIHRYMLQRMGLWRNAIGKILQKTTDAQIDDHGISCCQFFSNVVKPRKRFIGDVYAYTFFLDLVCIFIGMLGYSHFADTSSDDIMLIHTNRIPLSMVIFLFILIVLLIFDRALYLRKSVVLKLIYHFLITIAIHVWLFAVVPIYTRTTFSKNHVAQVFYILKGITLLLSGWQIKHGYPPLSTGNLLTRQYGVVNYLLFKGFMVIPFAFELRSFIDWIWTDTAMSLFDFIKVEFYFSYVYFVKCIRVIEQNFPQPRGQGKSKITKHLMGIPLVLVLICLILSPLLTFALINSIGESMSPTRLEFTMSFGSTPPFYKAVTENLVSFSEDDRNEIKEGYNNLENSNRPNARKARSALSFLTEFFNEDIYKISFQPYSVSRWAISKGALEVLYENLLANESVSIEVHILVNKEKGDEQIQSDIRYALNISKQAMMDLKHILGGNLFLENLTDYKMTVQNVLPYYFLAPSKNNLKVAMSMLTVMGDSNKDNSYPDDMVYRNTFSNLHLSLKRLPLDQIYWEAKFVRSPLMANVSIQGKPEEGSKVDMVMFLDRLAPSWLNAWFHPSIITMYLAFVFMVFKMVRSWILTNPLHTIIMEMPNPNPLLRIFLDLYLVREAQDFLMEEDLYAKLIFLFRSPNTLIKWSRYRTKAE